MLHSDARKLADGLMLEYKVAPGWKFNFDNAKRRAGRCSFRLALITLSWHYVERNSYDDVRDTILHEIAHAIAGPGVGHGPAWKVVCRRIGCRPIRCYGNHIDMPEGKYKAVCGGCQKEFRRHRRSRQGAWRYCLNCGPEKGRLTFGVCYESV